MISLGVCGEQAGLEKGCVKPNRTTATTSACTTTYQALLRISEGQGSPHKCLVDGTALHSRPVDLGLPPQLRICRTQCSQLLQWRGLQRRQPACLPQLPASHQQHRMKSAAMFWDA